MDKDLLQRIHNNEIGAISLDTSIFDGQQLNFEGGLLDRMKQFEGMGVRVVIADVVQNEVLAHLRRNAADAIKKIEQGIADATRHKVLSLERQVELRASLGEKEDLDAALCKRFGDWVDQVGGEVVDAGDYVNMGDLTDMYFGTVPPFASSGTKKNEFPDAIALLTLEEWANDRDTKVLAVSTDDGWSLYAEESHNLFVVKDLGDALAAFQGPTVGGACRALVASLGNGDSLGLKVAVHRALADQIDQIEITVDAESQFSVAEQSVERVTVEDIGFDEPEYLHTLFKPISLTDGRAVVEITTQATLGVDCYLRFDKRVERENLPMGSTRVSESEDVEVSALVTLGGNIPDAMTIESVEILPAALTVYFYDVLPDFMK